MIIKKLSGRKFILINPMEKEIIKLTNEQWRNLVQEEFLEIDGEEVAIQIIQQNYDGSRRHTEDHHMIFQRLLDGKFFRVDYETSVKDEMGWDECNYGDTNATEVFPEKVETIIYK
jgi:hypothetical protein